MRGLDVELHARRAWLDAVDCEHERLERRPSGIRLQELNDLFESITAGERATYGIYPNG